MRHPTCLLAISLLLFAVVTCDFISGFVPPVEVGNVLDIGESDNPTITAPRFPKPR